MAGRQTEIVGSDRHLGIPVSGGAKRAHQLVRCNCQVTEIALYFGLPEIEGQQPGEYRVAQYLIGFLALVLGIGAQGRFVADGLERELIAFTVLVARIVVDDDQRPLVDHGVFQNLQYQVHVGETRLAVVAAQLDVADIGPAFEEYVQGASARLIARPVHEKVQDIHQIGGRAQHRLAMPAAAQIERAEQVLQIRNIAAEQPGLDHGSPDRIEGD